ncbi:MAG: hypothetical protein IT158_13995 [Bryobacterales bacterium]|nr:hypothetical protein [Bryobacterales bacterium]
MHPLWVLLAYGSSAGLALLLVYYFAVRWYWHLASAGLAFVIGLVPLPLEWRSPQLDLAVGWVFVFLFIWGVAEPLFTTHHHHPRHA